jgi:hypothetical protein
VSSMDKIIAVSLEHATIGQLAYAIQKRLPHSTEVKIKPQWVRVQHISHNDRLCTPEAIDAALALNPAIAR